MSPAQKLFSTYSTVLGNHPRHIKVGSNQALPVAGVGSIVLQCEVRGSMRKVTLHNVLHIPALAANLVSLPVVCSKGGSALFGARQCTVRLRSDDVFTACLEGGVFRLANTHVILRETEQSKAKNIGASAATSSLRSTVSTSPKQGVALTVLADRKPQTTDGTGNERGNEHAHRVPPNTGTRQSRRSPSYAEIVKSRGNLDVHKIGCAFISGHDLFASGDTLQSNAVSTRLIKPRRTWERSAWHQSFFKSVFR